MSAPNDDGASSEEGGEINVVPFLDIITNVLMFVLATVAVTFTSTIDVSMPRPGRRPPVEASLGLTVLVVGDGFSLKAQGGNVAPGCSDTGEGVAVPKKNGEYDFNALRECATKVKASAPAFAGEHMVTVSANPQIPYDVVIGAVDAVRMTPGGDDLFPDVAFAIAR